MSALQGRRAAGRECGSTLPEAIASVLILAIALTLGARSLSSGFAAVDRLERALHDRLETRAEALESRAVELETRVEVHE